MNEIVENSSIPAHVRDFVTLMLKKHSQNTWSKLDTMRYTRVIAGLTEQQTYELLFAVDEQFEFRPDVAAVARVRDTLFPGTRRNYLPPALEQAYKPLLEDDYYSRRKPVYGPQLLIEGANPGNDATDQSAGYGEEVNDDGICRLKALVEDLSHRMTPEERQQLGRLKEERARDEKAKAKKTGPVQREQSEEDALAAMQRKQRLIRAQVEYLQKKEGSDDTGTMGEGAVGNAEEHDDKGSGEGPVCD